MPLEQPTIVETTLTVADLDVSTFNVRTDRRDIDDTSVLEASIAERGLIQAIAVHPMRGSRGRYGVFAGGRRYRSIRNLVARGALPADWPVPVRDHRGYSDAQLIELSIAENLVRRELRDYELYAAVRRAHAKGDSVETIAAVLGQNIALVRKWLRMGQLADPIFAAFRTDRISLEQAQAFAATEDTVVQLQAWDALRVSATELRPGTDAARIRAAMNIGDVELGRLLVLVGAEAYRAAGGTFELDLFAGEVDQRGRIVDAPLLRRLAETRLDAQRADLRRRAGRPELRFLPQPPENEWGGADTMLELHPDGGEGDALELPEGDIVATLTLRADGDVDVRWWWASRSAKFGNRRPAPPRAAAAPPRSATGAAPARTNQLANALNDAASPGIARAANSRLKSDAGVTGPTVEILRSIRRALLRAMLVEDATSADGANTMGYGTVALDYLVWGQLRLLLGRGQGTAFAHSIGLVPIGALAADPPEALPHLRAMPGWRRWRSALELLERERFAAAPDLVESFACYRAAPAATKQIAAALVAGLALERSLADPDFGVALHDAVAIAADGADGIAVRALWEPTTDLLARIGRDELLAIAEPFVERVTFGAWQRLKREDLAERVHELVTGSQRWARASAAEAATRWVHPLLSFGGAPATSTDADMSVSEVAA